MTANLGLERFADIDLADPFFDSLKLDYAEFPEWFEKKADERAYTSRQIDGSLDGFLYLKREDGPLNDMLPALPPRRRIKVGTFKINPHGTRLGERFIKKVFDHALAQNVQEIYVTVFPKYEALVDLFTKYGFLHVAKLVSKNGEELVLTRDVFTKTGEVVKDYPLIPIGARRHWLLSLYPVWHTRLLPDSILKTEQASILEDVSHTNSIHKIYLTAMKGIEGLRRGDTLLIYRTNDGAGHARFRSVVTSVCVVEELRHISEFPSASAFQEYCSPYSIFSADELKTFYKTKKYPWLIRFTYNLALRKRINRHSLIEDVGFDQNAYWGFLPVKTEQLKKIFQLIEQDETTLVH